MVVVVIIVKMMMEVDYGVERAGTRQKEDPASLIGCFNAATESPGRHEKREKEKTLNLHQVAPTPPHAISRHHTDHLLANWRIRVKLEEQRQT